MKRWVRLAISIAIAASATPAWSQDATKGETIFRRCRACHSVGPSARNKAGPQLNGVVGRKAASVPGFNYSEAMKQAASNGLVWTEVKLKAYLESPDTFLPKGEMAFAGIKDNGDLADLVAFLKTQQ